MKIILLTFIIINIVGFTVFLVGNTAKTPSTNQNNNSQTLPPQNGNSTGITLGELAKHSSKTDCWVVYKGAVYDLTSWLPRHPGGINAIAPYCGNQGFEAAFIRQHGSRMASLFLQVAKFMGDFKLQGDLAQ